MNNMIKNKAIGYYVSCASAVIGLISGVLLWIYGTAVDDFYAVPPCLLIIGAILVGISLAKHIQWMAILPGCCYIGSFAIYLSSQLDNISGRISNNGIGITGTSLNAMFTFFGLMLTATILSVIASFMKQSEEDF